jgi:hypothetical protein
MNAKRRTAAAPRRRAAPTGEGPQTFIPRSEREQCLAPTKISFAELERMKQGSRDADAADLASGRKTTDDLRRENELFYGVRFYIDFKNCKHPK